MADSIRELITQAVLSRMQTVTVVNGYETDVGLMLERARRSFEEDELPAGAVWPGPEESAAGYQNTGQEMQIDIDLHSRVGNETADKAANRLIADARKGMETYDAPLAALIDGLQYAGADPQYPEDGGEIVSVKVTYKITYQTVRGDPYASP
ncbi:MAG: hypothetical protein RPU15_08565 [Candidatus Sedimenticola sp. (ex Thyasira tokunagai)]